VRVQHVRAMPSDTPSRRHPLALGWEAIRANIIPPLILQALMLSIFVGYHVSPTCAAALKQLAGWKQEHGLAFVILSTVTVAALLPELLLILLFQGGRPRTQNLRNLLFTAPMWAIDGVAIDLLYRGLAAVFGDAVTLPILAAKLSVDLFLFSVFFAAPYGVLAYHWKNSGYSFAALRESLTLYFYRAKIVPTLFMTWAIWGPLSAMIYSLPLALQFPFFSLALTFWALLLTYMTNRFAGKSGHPAAVAAQPIPAP
jgi:hypothetical protein